ncbi:hypothetical protein [Micromonospora sp. NPDC049645]|uniref:hypothetical protein n=1 Tax=Micromonospora sp. NPDC049645 TaxID=3155508 RepID=UPI003443481E
MSDNPHADVDADAEPAREIVTAHLPGDEPASSRVPSQRSDSRIVYDGRTYAEPWQPAPPTPGHEPHDVDEPADLGPAVSVELFGQAAPVGVVEPAPRYLAVCRPCDIGQLPFRDESSRDRWAAIHATSTGHRVTLATDDPDTGSTITGYADPPTRLPDPVPLVRGTAPVDDAARPPLVEFVAYPGRAPDLVCTIAPQAGAAWLLVAAHACMVGRGSLGVEQPQRVLYTGRATRTQLGGWSIRIDGVLGAEHPYDGRAVGDTFGVDGADNPTDVEQAAAAWVADLTGRPVHEVVVVLLVDGPQPGASLPEAAPVG